MQLPWNEESQHVILKKEFTLQFEPLTQFQNQNRRKELILS